MKKKYPSKKKIEKDFPEVKNGARVQHFENSPRNKKYSRSASVSIDPAISKNEQDMVGNAIGSAHSGKKFSVHSNLRGSMLGWAGQRSLGDIYRVDEVPERDVDQDITDIETRRRRALDKSMENYMKNAKKDREDFI
jgi:hypothetical protein